MMWTVEVGGRGLGLKISVKYFFAELGKENKLLGKINKFLGLKYEKGGKNLFFMGGGITL